MPSIVPDAEHYAGPSLKWRILPDDPGLQLRTQHLFATAQAREEAKGQLPLNLELEL